LTGKKPPKSGRNWPPGQAFKWLLFHLETKHFLKGYRGPENLAESLPETMSAAWIAAEVGYLFFKKNQTDLQFFLPAF